MKRSVIFDTNMNFGFPGASIDSGLALLCLLGMDDVDIIGITLSMGNEALAKARDAVSWILRLNSRTDIPVFDGCDKPGEYISDAALFLAETASELKGEVTVITTASLGNIYGAALESKKFYSHVSQIIVTGGLLHPFQVPFWKRKADTALSLDPIAAKHVLNKGQNLVLMNMHIGSQVLLNIDDLVKFREYNIQLYYLVKEHLLSDECRELNGKSVAYLWAMLPVMYIGNSGLFHKLTCHINVDKKTIEKGMIELSETGNRVIMPDYICDIDEFYKKMYLGWKMSPFQKWPDSPPDEGAGL